MIIIIICWHECQPEFPSDADDGFPELSPLGLALGVSRPGTFFYPVRGIPHFDEMCDTSLQQCMYLCACLLYAPVLYAFMLACCFGSFLHFAVWLRAKLESNHRASSNAGGGSTVCCCIQSVLFPGPLMPRSSASQATTRLRPHANAFMVPKDFDRTFAMCVLL